MRRRGFQEINRIKTRKIATEATEALLMEDRYLFLIYQLSVYFSKNVDSSLTHKEYLNFWGREVNIFFEGKGYGFFPDTEKAEQLIQVVPPKN